MSRSRFHWLRPFLILLLGVSGCADSGSTTGPDPTPPEEPDPVRAPSVELHSSYNFEGSDDRSSVTVANGESIALDWSTTNEPTTCQASGDWSGSKSCSSTGEIIGPLTGPDTLTFRLKVENSAGSDTDSARVFVGQPGEVHARSDRQDDKSGSQFHVLYVVPNDVEPREIDLNGGIANSLEIGQKWLEDEADGRRLRFDTYNGKLDISFFRLEKTNAEVDEGGGFASITDELDAAGFNQDNKKYLVLYGGTEDDHCGEAAKKYAFVYMEGSNGLTCSNDFPDSSQDPGEELNGVASVAVHELVHSLGAVDVNAPNHNGASAGHVTDEPRDLMYSSAGGNPPGRPAQYLDHGRDDYFSPSGELPDNVTNIADSPFFIH